MFDDLYSGRNCVIMGFTTPIFVFAFLPLCLITYYGVRAIEKLGRIGRWFEKIRLHDVLLAIAGMGFYAWSCFDNIFRLLVYALLVYVFGYAISKSHTANLHVMITDGKETQKKYPLRNLITGSCVAAVLFCLIYSKYWTEVVSVWEWLFNTTIQGHSITAPLAISFLTFSAISYLADISKGKATEGNLLDCLLYLSFFPKIISGPTVLWRDFQTQISNRKTNLDGLSDGFTRIMIGFVKKVLIADTVGACLSKIPAKNIDVPTAWISAFLYMLQIYYVFAGYSDIAIGLAKLFGFEVKENFNFPYCSISIGEFWRRWHISLGSWFREYVYFPLGGSRGGMKKTLRNLGIVFLLTGLWHGNGWNYLIWGGINAVCVILERILSGKPIYEGLPKWLKWLATMFITLICWEFFRYGSFHSVLRWGAIACGLIKYQNINTWQYYFDAQIATIAVIGLLGATIFGMKSVRTRYQKLISCEVGYAIQQIILLVLFVIAVMFMVSSGYSPFIYFQY